MCSVVVFIITSLCTSVGCSFGRSFDKKKRKFHNSQCALPLELPNYCFAIVGFLCGALFVGFGSTRKRIRIVKRVLCAKFGSVTVWEKKTDWGKIAEQNRFPSAALRWAGRA